MENLKEIINGITNNELLLPNFQREFVWSLNQQKDLIASVLSAVPASSSLLVEEKEFNKPNFNCIKVGRRNDTKPIIHKGPFHYILDGQQRFTTLYFAFYNIYNNENAKKNQDIYKELNDKLRVRWFLELKSENSYLFDYDTLIFNEKVFDKYLPDNFIDFINESKIKQTDLGDNNNNIDSLKNKCLKDRLIPLQLFLTDDNYKIKSWLTVLQNKRQVELKTNREYKESLIKIFEFCNISNPEKIAEDLYKDDEKAKNIFNNCISDEKICNWDDKLFNYLKNIISSYTIKPIVLKDMFKAISTFEYINTRGTDLATFDLLCAKVGGGFDLRKSVIEESNKPFHFFNSSFDKDDKVILKNNFGLIDSNDSIQKQYAEYLSQVFNLLHYKEKIGTPDNKSFNNGLQKAKYSLDNLDSDFLENNYKKAVEVINKTSAMLQIFCAHSDYKKITNKLILLPIFTFFIYNEKPPTKDAIKKLIAFFWIKLLSGKYNSHQSEMANKHCIDVYNWIILNDSQIPDELKKELNEYVLNVEEFATKKLLTSQKCIKSVEDNIFMFIRSLNTKFYDWDDSSSKLEITDEVQIHHIIPLFSGISKMKELTKFLRNDPKNILNATMNKTPISKKINGKIGAKSPSQYIDDVNSTQLNHHFVNQNWFKANLKKEDKKKLFEVRYDTLLGEIRRKLDEYID